MLSVFSFTVSHAAKPSKAATNCPVIKTEDTWLITTPKSSDSTTINLKVVRGVVELNQSVPRVTTSKLEETDEISKAPVEDQRLELGVADREELEDGREEEPRRRRYRISGAGTSLVSDSAHYSTAVSSLSSSALNHEEERRRDRAIIKLWRFHQKSISDSSMTSKRAPPRQQ
ncbi:hypothetical protein HID58_095133 [Brassica napus]|uniref:Uncharacterized protein n=1 Tax=Brassica napus TaxID=3708 RepID=A0ABQ7X4P8_BRANA|nr:hypothetical protein HID58_095133 [Brassica napus]